MDEWAASSISRVVWDEFKLGGFSVVTDYGCDTGEILAHLRLLGLDTFVGIESWDRRADLRAKGWRIPEEQVQFADLNAPLPEVFQRSAHVAVALNVQERVGPDPKIYLDNVAMLSDVLVFNWLPDREAWSATESDRILWIAELQARGQLLDQEASGRVRHALNERHLPWSQIPWIFRRR